jgi:4-diphosphocytidyl-2-C-methyl-D-erythritol kinase
MSAPAVSGIAARAFAKVNLGLEVLRRREDGYHELRTVLSTIDFCDQLRFERRRSGIELAVTTERGNVPEGEGNLVHRAATLLAEASGCRAGASIHLEKKVPAGAGLGGGSSDAAVTLLALDRLWGLRASPSDLHGIASRLGMDVPFFLHGGTALAVGRGDEVYPLATELELPIVLILPDFSISTAEAYGNLRLTNRESGLTLQHFAWGVPNIGVALRELCNDLEGAAGVHSTSIQEYKRLLLESGAFAAMMSGSGSSVFGIFQDEVSAEECRRWLRLRRIRAIATKTLQGAEYRARLLRSTESAKP